MNSPFQSSWQTSLSRSWRLNGLDFTTIFPIESPDCSMISIVNSTYGTIDSNVVSTNMPDSYTPTPCLYQSLFFHQLFIIPHSSFHILLQYKTWLSKVWKTWNSRGIEFRWGKTWKCHGILVKEPKMMLFHIHLSLETIFVRSKHPLRISKL